MKSTAWIALLLAAGMDAQSQPGTKIWEFAAGSPVQASAAIGTDGVIYSGCDDGRLYAINPNGTKRWEFAAGRGIVSSPAIGGDGTLYVGSVGARLFALSPRGVLEWEFAVLDAIRSSPAVGVDGTVYFGSLDHRLYAVDPEGNPKWEFWTGGAVFSSPAVDVDGTIYFGSRDRKIYALKPDGTKKWEFLTGNSVDCSPVVGTEGAIYCGSADARLYALNRDGSRRWEFVAQGPVSSSPTVALDGTVYVAAGDRKLYAINSSGVKRWEVPLAADALGCSVALSSDGTIYAALANGVLYAFGPDGSSKWSFAAGTMPLSSSPTVGSSGTVYLGSGDGRLIAIRGTGGLQPGAWPMFRRDPAHTASGFVERVLPGGYSPGAPVEVKLAATPPSTVGSYVIEDTPPQNWVVSEVSDSGFFDSANRRIRFGPFLDSDPRTLRYVATPPLSETGLRQFAGTSAADGSERLMGGSHVLEPIPLHPADVNTVDRWLTLGELTAYASSWKRGSSWQTGPSPIPSSYVIRAITLWAGGEYYRFDTNFATAPLWWTNPAQPPEGLIEPAPANLTTNSSSGSAEADMPDTYQIGIPFTVTITTAPSTNTLCYAVEDRPPAGWTVAAQSIVGDGWYDAARGKVKWGPFFDASARTLSYQVTPSTDAEPFTGLASFDGVSVAVGGQREAIEAGHVTPEPVAVRDAPAEYSPGVPLMVTILVTPGTNGIVYAVEDSPPAGWVVGEIGDSGIFDRNSGCVRFGPFFDSFDRELSYEVTPPVTQTGEVEFAGRVLLEEAEQETGGQARIELAPLHPADVAIRDRRITIGEVTAYGSAWKKGASWPVAPNPIPVNYLARAAQLWLGGEAYRYDSTVTNYPAWWISRQDQAPANLPVTNVVTTSSSGEARATMPESVLPGARIHVSIAVAPTNAVLAYAVEDQVPSGWVVETNSIAAGGIFDPWQGKVKWGPFYDASLRNVEYDAIAPVDARGTNEFRGLAAFDNVVVLVGGTRQVSIVTVEPIQILAERKLPYGYSPGMPMTVEIQTGTLTNVLYYVVVDVPPAGWQVGAISDGGVFDSVAGGARFGPFFDSSARSLSYEVTPPASETGPREFVGTVFAGDTRGAVGGAVKVEYIPLHPADLLARDRWMTLGELTAYAAAWKKGSSWVVEPNPIPVSFVAHAITLWQQGEAYGYDAAQTNAPLVWITLAGNAPTNAPQSPAASGSATNGEAIAIMPLTVRPGEQMTVSIQVTPRESVSVYAIEEQMPPGWIVVSDTVSDGGVLDPWRRKLKWGPFFDSTARTLKYTVTAPAAGGVVARFSGLAAFDSGLEPVDGVREVGVFGQGSPAIFAHRSLPPAYSPGATMTVELMTDSLTNVAFFVVEDTPPASWQVVDVSESGYFDPANRKVKFGPFFGPFEDLGAQTLSYRVTPPLGESGLRLFKGASLVDGVEGVISGDDVLDVIPLHPADAQPIDGWMTLGEVTGYAACWRRGLTWQFPPNPIQTKFVTQAIALWLGGEVYGFDSTQASAPYWWSVAADPLLYRREPPGVPPGAAATNGTALVTMPRTFAPGAPFEIVITVQPAAGVAVCAVEDELPEGWEVVLPAISEGAIYDPARRKVKWGPFLGAEPRRLTYQAIPPPLPDPVAQFGGGAAFDGSVGALAGRRQTFLAGAEPRLVFKSVSFSPDSGAAITASGATNEAYVVEVSPNLADWERWLTFTNTAAAVQLLDVTATNINQRFYRALWK